jgi:hypothetical protein
MGGAEHPNQTQLPGCSLNMALAGNGVYTQNGTTLRMMVNQ